MYIQSQLLLRENVNHAFFTRNGGVSQGIFHSLNCSLNGYDTESNILQNREIAANALGYDIKDLQMLKQIHSNKVVTINKSNLGSYIEADAMVTNIPGILLGIQTADCCPIIFSDQMNQVIGITHAGWRGALAGIIQNTLATMQTLGSQPENISAVIGPSIAQESYEVDHLFRTEFLNQSHKNLQYFISSQDSHKYKFDLKKYCFDILQNENVKSIEDMKIDTYTSKQDFYSFRRTTHEGQPKSGGQLSAVSISCL